MDSVRSFFNGVDETLSGKVEYFKPVTYAVDALTHQFKSNGAKRAIQVLTYPAHIIDTVIQGVASVAFALYKTVKGIVNEYKTAKTSGDVAYATFKLVASPVTFASRLYIDLVVVTGYGAFNVLPFRTLADVINPTRSLTRISTFNQEFKPLSYVNLSDREIEKVTNHLKSSLTLSILGSFETFKERPSSMARSDVFSGTRYDDPDHETASDEYYIHQFGVFMARVTLVKPIQIAVV